MTEPTITVEEIEKWMDDLIPIERNETTAWPLYDERMERYFKVLIQNVKELDSECDHWKGELIASDAKLKEVTEAFNAALDDYSRWQLRGLRAEKELFDIQEKVKSLEAELDKEKSKVHVFEENIRELRDDLQRFPTQSVPWNQLFKLVEEEP